MITRPYSEKNNKAFAQEVLLQSKIIGIDLWKPITHDFIKKLYFYTKIAKVWTNIINLKIADIC